MRTGLSTIQQTLTPEAASLLNLAIAEAARRNHGQTTPLHVAATLLASPSGFLRQACIRSHPNSSHPLQCRALELCFSVALDRLPTAQNGSAAVAAEPPLSNALMAALKRAQAHQRRGCPEQQQQPLLAVKVELEQLILSILDDPSISRVMREASFSSIAVKATIEQSLNSQPSSVNPPPIGIGFRPTPTTVPLPNRNLYLNPRLQQSDLAQFGQQRSEVVKRVTDILLRSKRKNPVLVGELEPAAVIRELLGKIEKGELGDGSLKNVQVIPMERQLASDQTQIPNKFKELGGLIQALGDSGVGGIILDLGDLKWLVEQPMGLGFVGSGGIPPPVALEMGRAAVAEVAKLLARFGDGGSCRLWLVGTATCETFLRCQVYHPSMETEWDLQAVPIASKPALPGMLPRPGANGNLSSSVEPLNPFKNFHTATTALPRRPNENLVEPARKTGCCPQCTESYEQELGKLVAEEHDKSSSEQISEADWPSLPQWMQNAKVIDFKSSQQSQIKDEEMKFKQKSQELQKKWNDNCLHLHPNFHQSRGPEKIYSTTLPVAGLFNPNLLTRQTLQPKLQQTRNLGNAENLQLNTNPMATQPSEQGGSPPGSPVRTDLVLGRTKTIKTSTEDTHKDHAKDLLGCISFEPQLKLSELQADKFAKTADVDSFKKLLKGLIEKVWWQRDAASAVATTVTRCKLGNGTRRGTGSRGDIWLLFTGPDRIGKKKMASVLSEQISGTTPIRISLGPRCDDAESDVSFRGKTALDRIAEAVRRNAFSVIMLEDIDRADMLVRGSIKRAMERGRLADFHGREISLGNIIFILTSNWLPDNLNNSATNHLLDEKKLASAAGDDWQLRLSVGEKSFKRRANWLLNGGRRRKQTSVGLSLDLNLEADIEDDRTDGSHNSSDLTVDHEEDHGTENRHFLTSSVPLELVKSMDDAIIFKPVEITSVRQEIESKIREKFSIAVDERVCMEVEEEALEKILGGLWFGPTSLEEWAEKVLVPSFQQLKQRLPADWVNDSVTVRLEINSCYSTDRITGDWLPSKVTVEVAGV